MRRLLLWMNWNNSSTEPMSKIANKHVFFLGIGGIGMSALARHLHALGHVVGGYDLTPSPLLKALAAFALLLWLMPVSAIALDTSAGVGLQDRALFQERVDYTLTNQSDVDFHGQQLTNTSFAGAVGRGFDLELGCGGSLPRDLDSAQLLRRTEIDRKSIDHR